VPNRGRRREGGEVWPSEQRDVRLSGIVRLDDTDRAAAPAGTSSRCVARTNVLSFRSRQGIWPELAPNHAFETETRAGERLLESDGPERLEVQVTNVIYGIFGLKGTSLLSHPLTQASAGYFSERWTMLTSTKRGARQAIAALGMSVLTAAGLGLALAVPASAAGTVSAASIAGRAIVNPAPADASQCPSNSACWWEHSNFTGVGAYEVLDQRYASGTCLTWSERWQGQISSLVNTSDRNLVVFQGKDCQGASFIVPPGMQIQDLGGFNDAVASFRV
jgi:hypothetical protein